MGRATDLVCSAHQWLKKIFDIFMKRFFCGKKSRYCSSSLWRKIERRGKIHNVSINPFVNYINEYKRVFALYTNGTLDLSHSRAAAAGLTGKQSRVLTQDSNSENQLRNFAVKNWNSMSYAQRKPFIDLALEKRKWLKRIDKRNVKIIDSLVQLDSPNHDISNVDTETRHEPEPESEPVAGPRPNTGTSSVANFQHCENNPNENFHSQHDMGSHKKSDDKTTRHRLKRKNGINNIDMEEENQLDLPNHDGPNVVTRANRKKIMRLRKRSRAHLRHCENSPSFSELTDESSGQLGPTVIPDAFITSGANFHSQHNMSSHKESDDEITAPRSNRKNGINNIDMEEENQLDLPNHDDPNVVTRANRKKIRKPKKPSRANLRHCENSHSFSEIEDVSSARSLSDKKNNNKRPYSEKIKPNEETNKTKKQCRKYRKMSEEVQMTPKREQRKKSGTVILK